MKKTIVIEILLAAVCAVLIYCTVITLREIPTMNWYIEYASSLSPDSPQYNYAYNAAGAAKMYIDTFYNVGIVSIVAATIDFIAIIIIAIKDFPVFKPLIGKLSAKFAARKEQRATTKAEQAATAKQERIEKLQAELDELKKDE